MELKNFYKSLLAIIMALLFACETAYYPTTGGGTGGSYTIYFDTDGGDYCYSKSGYYGDEIVLPLPYKFGYTFRGWYSSSGSYYGRDGDIYRITSSTTLYAHWGTGISQTFRISFDSQGGTYCSDRSADYGENITLPYTTKNGYSFGGWYSSPNGYGAYYGGGGETYRVYSDMILYAYWVLGENTIPSAPTGVSASAYSSENTIKISWNYVTNADYYEIYRSDNLNGSYYFVGYSYSNSFSDYAPYFSSQTYFYKVKALNTYGASAFSNVASATILGEINGVGTLVIKNISNIYNITNVYIGGVSYGSISKNSSMSYQLTSSNYRVEVKDDYGDDYIFTAYATIKSGQTTTLTYDADSFY